MTDIKTAPVIMTKDHFVAWAEQHIRVMVTGMVACNPGVPPDVMGDVLAEAMGRCLGSMSTSPILNEALEARRRLGQAFKHALRDAYPPLQPTLHVPGQDTIQ